MWLRKLVPSTTIVPVATQQLLLASAFIGINYGLNRDNLPPTSEVIKPHQRKGIPPLRLLFKPMADVLDSLRGTGIKISLGTRNEDLIDAAAQWLNT
ncbi:hypothetical protein Nepgr_019275 [Nepenthes gracilis]|uniref:Uncharacterized protein n=1 Tax=Nepenthes gracilis TaxID=150966 RepID=A0AAD3SVJ6_NEPGR|nr:hypothetical protein Nepgr_019275 [Nepenthes gracilis]